MAIGVDTTGKLLGAAADKLGAAADVVKGSNKELKKLQKRIINSQLLLKLKDKMTQRKV